MVERLDDQTVFQHLSQLLFPLFPEIHEK